MTATVAPPADELGIPFRRLVRVEWEKATDTRAARWLLAAVAASTIGLVLVPLLAPSSVDQTTSSYLGFAALALSILLPVVAILLLTSEWSQRTALTTFTQEPDRLRVVEAKVAVSLLLGLGAAAFGGLATGASLVAAAASGRAVEADLGAAVVVGFVLFVLVNVLSGVALGALLHSSAAAIAASFALPTAFASLGYAWKPAAQWLDSSTAFNRLLEHDWSAHLPQVLAAVALWVALPLVAGVVRTVRRDVA